MSFKNDVFCSKVTQINEHTQAFAPLFSGAKRNSQHCVYTYSSKRSRTRTPSAFATSCKRPTVMSRLPFIQLFTVCRLTLIRSARSPSLTFFSSSLCAGSAATHTVVSSLLFCFIILTKGGSSVITKEPPDVIPMLYICYYFATPSES